MDLRRHPGSRKARPWPRPARRLLRRLAPVAVALGLALPDPVAAQYVRDYDAGVQQLGELMSSQLGLLNREITEPLRVYVVPARSEQRLACEPLSRQLTNMLNADLSERLSRDRHDRILFQKVQGGADDAAITLRWSVESAEVVGFQIEMARFADLAMMKPVKVDVAIASVPENLRRCLVSEDLFARCTAVQPVPLANGPQPRFADTIGDIPPGSDFQVRAAYDLRDDDRAGALLVTYRLPNDLETAAEGRRAFVLGGTDQLARWQDQGVCEVFDWGRFEPRSRRAEPPWVARQQVQDPCPGCPRLRVLPEAGFALAPRGAAGYGTDSLSAAGIEVEVGRMLAVAETEITVGQWSECARARICDGPERTASAGRADDQPASVSHAQAMQYVAWLNTVSGRTSYRLPTEAEWEYAARGPDGGRYAWGDVLLRDHAVCRGCRPGAGTPAAPEPVRRFDANGWGLHDMSGNVWEWVSDCWGAPAPAAGPCPSGRRVVKGGSYADEPLALAVGSRAPALEGVPHPAIGFRVVATGPGPR